MKTVFKDGQDINVLEDLNLEPQHPKHPKYYEYERFVEKKDYDLHFLKYELAGIRLSYFDVKRCHPGIQLKELRSDSLDMIFFIDGILNVMDDDGNTEIVLPNRHNLCYTAPGEGFAQWRFDSNSFKVLTISLPKTILEHYPQGESKALKNFIAHGSRGNSARLHPTCMPIGTIIHQTIEEIIHCTKAETGKWIFLESKIHELLAMQLEQACTAMGDSTYTTQTKNIKKVHAVKEFISNNLEARTSLDELARQAGTNTFTLKKGFKALYGTSVFAYWNLLRMEKAKALLKESTLSIGEIAEQLGFKSQHHFSSTFKKAYGITPSQMRKP
ncbi:MAG: AraC family transcriptional regulator [Bacteroidota bacterium]